MRFEELGLSASVLRATKEMGFEEATPIQAEAIPLMMQGEDLIGQAKTGTGKTAAFGIHLLETLDFSVRVTQALVLTPTRELCQQVCEEIRRLGRHTGARVVSLYGGQDIEKQLGPLRQGAHIVVGTPGRVLDHLERGTLDLRCVRTVVIDECDRMLDMGFIEDVSRILERTPRERQTLLFSATMPFEIRQLAGRYMRSPQFVKVSEDETPVITHIRQEFAVADPKERLYALLSYLKRERPALAMIFCRTKFGAEKLGTILRDRGFKAECLHGNMTQNKRDWVMRRFREGQFQLLVATDLAARGLDVDGVTHVINYNMPDDHFIYTHRVGRTGRMGKGGNAFTLVARDELGKLGQIERALGIKMEELKLDYRGPGRHPGARPPAGRPFHGHREEREGTHRWRHHGGEGRGPRSPVPRVYNLI